MRIFSFVAFILILAWGWKVKTWHLEAMKTNKTLRLATILINGICLVILIIFLLRHALR